MQIDIITAVTFLGIPSAVTAFCFWLIKRKMDKSEKEREERDRAKYEHQVLLMDILMFRLPLHQILSL